ncbi:MAG: polyprenyl synthetase family protein [Chitinophagaceae bacterium]|nr:polyprenyl synthetase family protein [Chitinophagaceae bacterium]
MHSFEELLVLVKEKFNVKHFPVEPSSLYAPNEYFLSLGGKRIRPVMCVMGNELFDTINPNVYHLANAIELFHNFTLIHDDIMDKAPLRRGMQTVHTRYGEPTALLAGDVMLVRAYDYLNMINSPSLHKIIHIFNRTAREVCEGQQLDMDFEKQEKVILEDYIRMIELKTSVLLAACLQLGAVLGGAGQDNQNHLYQFGKNLGIAFQLQDDYLDAFGDPGKFGKQIGGDIMANKKTFLMIKTLEVANDRQTNEIQSLIKDNPANKVDRMLEIFRDCGVDNWAKELKDRYVDTAFSHFEDIAVSGNRKDPLRQLAMFLIEREH